GAGRAHAGKRDGGTEPERDQGARPRRDCAARTGARTRCVGAEGVGFFQDRLGRWRWARPPLNFGPGPYLLQLASSTIQPTSSVNVIPACAASSGTSEVAVMPGCVLTSRHTSSPAVSS